MDVHCGKRILRGVVRASHTRRIDMLTTMELWDDAALASLIAGATLLGTDLKAGLFTNAIVPSKTLVIAGLTEPVYASYLRQVVVMGPVIRDPLNGIAALAAGLNWQMTGTPTPTIVYGIFYTYGAGPLLLGVELFANPIPLNDDLDAFLTVLEYIQSSDNAGLTTVVR